MAKRLGLEAQSYVDTLPYDRVRALFSLPMLFENFTRWYNADERPGASDEKHFETLDALLPDGSITWSSEHMALFTQERARREALAFAEKRQNDPPVVDPAGVDAFEKLLGFLKEKGVQVYLVNPPFNPIYYDRVQGSAYAEGLKRIEDTGAENCRVTMTCHCSAVSTRTTLAATATMYIDAEHSNDKCLKKIFDQFMAIDRAKAGAMMSFTSYQFIFLFLPLRLSGIRAGPPLGWLAMGDQFSRASRRWCSTACLACRCCWCCMASMVFNFAAGNVLHCLGQPSTRGQEHVAGRRCRQSRDAWAI